MSSSTDPVSYKVACRTTSCGPDDWSYNRLRFATKGEAEAYAKNLYRRWTALKTYEVQPSDDPVTQKEVNK